MCGYEGGAFVAHKHILSFSDVGCRSGWVQHGFYCYHFSTVVGTWAEAAVSDVIILSKIDLFSML